MIDEKTIRTKMDKLHLKQVDLVLLLGINKSTISLHMKGRRLTKYSKAAYYYLFEVLEAKDAEEEKESIDSPDFNEITRDFIKEQMTRHKLKSKDLVKDLGFDKSTVSQIVNGLYKLNKPLKAAFWYYFHFCTLEQSGNQ